jgi:hypothetical protein
MKTVEDDRAAFRADLRRRGTHPMVYDPSRMREVCFDCGATSEEIDDNLAPSCDPVPAGPNRDAIVIIRGELLRANLNVEQLQRHLASAEDTVVRLARDIRMADARRRELAASLEKLERA